MKILYIITQADGGGAQNYVLALARHFKGAIAAGTEEQGLFVKARQAGIPAYGLRHLKRNISPWHDLLAILEIARLANSLKPDIVHLNSTKAGFLGSLVKPFVKAKIIFTAHGFRYSEPLSPVSKFFYLWLEKFASLFRSYIIAVSDSDKNSALQKRLIAPEKIRTVHNGIPPLPFLTRDEARSRLGLPQHVITLGNTSNFYKTKGQDILVEAAATLPREILDKVVFVIFGSGPEYQNLKSKILNLKLESSFRLLGQVPDARLYLKALDIFVLPSRKEGFPYALLEAMQAGLPIIAANVGGNREALGSAAILVPPQDPRALARAMVTVIRDRNAAETLSQKSSQQSRLFTEEQMLKETENVYCAALKYNLKIQK
ncbi:MAG: glycosyltransferase family 4 protein [Patescibacteria group bacterium]|nr:glycosyltransferase family 4 protein [Patescibacteria group bacterium]